MSIRILQGDVRDMLQTLDADSVDCVVTSPPYWGLRDYGVDGQIGQERSLGEHLDVLVEVFREVRRVMKPEATLWINYGDCYATSPNGRSAAATKAAGTDDRTFRDKPFSTVGPVYGAMPGEPMVAANGTKRRGGGNAPAGAVYDPGHSGGAFRGDKKRAPVGDSNARGRIVASGFLKPKDLCMVANRLAIALQDDGWWIRAENVWGKPNPMPDSSGRYRPSTAHEKVWLLTKSAKSYYDALAVRMPCEESSTSRLAQDVAGQLGSSRANAGAKTNGNMKAVGDGESRLFRNFEPAPWEHIGFCGEVWNIATAGFSEAHFATFPPALVEPCIASGCPAGGLVLDPFGGAGTTGLVADRMGRDAILVELNPESVAISERRIKGDSPLFAEVA
jgi:DNA modification methylase